MPEKSLLLFPHSAFPIKGTLNRGNKRANSLIIFVPGFLENQHHHLFYNAARYFPGHGVDTFRFDLYATRKFNRTLLVDSAGDLRRVARYFAGRYRVIHLVAHSLGAYLVLLARPPVTGSAVFWDPSLHPAAMYRSAKHFKGNSHFRLETVYPIVLSGKVYEDAQRSPTIRQLLQDFSLPLYLVTAEHGAQKIGREIYFNNAHQPKKLTLIKGTGHSFDELGKEEQLFRLTLEWVKGKRKDSR
jgi:pimeloyl-ACP methyl ester carboxylesterase